MSAGFKDCEGFWKQKMFKAQREPIELHMFWQTWHAINDEWQNLLGFDREPVSVADKDLARAGF